MVSISTVARMVPGSIPSVSSAKANTSAQSLASRCDSIFGR